MGKHQGMDRSGVRQVPQDSGEQGKMEEIGCEIICGAPTTLAATGKMMMMMMMMTTWVADDEEKNKNASVDYGKADDNDDDNDYYDNDNKSLRRAYVHFQIFKMDMTLKSKN